MVMIFFNDHKGHGVDGKVSADSFTFSAESTNDEVLLELVDLLFHFHFPHKCDDPPFQDETENQRSAIGQ